MIGPLRWQTLIVKLRTTRLSREAFLSIIRLQGVSTTAPSSSEGAINAGSVEKELDADSVVSNIPLPMPCAL